MPDGAAGRVGERATVRRDHGGVVPRQAQAAERERDGRGRGVDVEALGAEALGEHAHDPEESRVTGGEDTDTAALARECVQHVGQRPVDRQGAGAERGERAEVAGRAGDDRRRLDGGARFLPDRLAPGDTDHGDALRHGRRPPRRRSRP